MSIREYTSRFFTLRHVRDSVLLAVRWGLVAFAVIEREERYCEIAARRMAQEVLPLYEVTP